MAPEDRRAALIDATVPLLQEYGPDVSTRQIAAAAGVAEGTIFGVFPDKNSLVVAALVRALDPQPTLDAIAAIDARLDLRQRLTQAAELVHERFIGNAPLLAAARRLMTAGAGACAAQHMAESRQRLLGVLTTVIEPSAGELRRSPATTARLMLLYCGANTFGPFGDPGFTGEEMVSLLLDGLLIVHTDEDPMIIPIGETDKC
jgi:AcrR family transcriptional regulator